MSWSKVEKSTGTTTAVDKTKSWFVSGWFQEWFASFWEEVDKETGTFTKVNKGE